MQRIDKITIWTFWVFRALLIIGGFLSVLGQNWMNLLLFVLTLFLTFLPSILEKELKIDSPSESELILVIFIFASMYLGEIHAFYIKFWWWDLMLHTVSGFIIADIGFMLVYILNKQKKLKLTPIFVAMFSFSFAVSLGVLWEIFEFTMDSVFGVNMQKSGLVDTMWDLIVDSIGALIVSLIGYYYLKGKILYKSMKRWEEEFMNKNPDLFK